MDIFIIILPVISLIVILSNIGLLYSEKKQVQEIIKILSEVKTGNGNRHILAKPNHPLSSLIYEINDIIRSYEDKITDYKQADEANKQLMTSLSHDVRTPLTTLIGYLDAVYKGYTTDIEREQYIKTSRKKAYELKNYIDVLFDWFKLNSNEFSIVPQNIEITELTRNILIDWVPILEEHKIYYSIDIVEQPVVISIDSDSYQRIINNLMQNIIMHSQASFISLSLVKSGKNIQVTISDNGIGMSKENLKHIFSRLYKCDTSRSNKGSGLGLSIAYRLAEKAGGNLIAKSSPGQGTSFILSLPLI